MSRSDGLLEVVALRGPFELASVKVLGQRSAQKLAQGSSFDIHVLPRNPLADTTSPAAATPTALDKNGDGKRRKDVRDGGGSSPQPDPKTGTVRSMPLQVDGEPWLQRACCLRIRRSNPPQAMLLAPRSREVDADLVRTLDWAQQRGIITSDQGAQILAEYTIRVESRKPLDQISPFFFEQ